MSWFVSPFTGNTFMVRALVAGVLVALLCAVAGTFVVLRGLAFIGDALAHGVLPGVAGALLLGAPGIVGAAVGSAVMIVGVSAITHRTRLSSDTAIGLLFGLFAGIVAALLIERMRQPVRDAADLVQAAGVPVLGVLGDADATHPPRPAGFVVPPLPEPPVLTRIVARPARGAGHA